MALLDSLVSSMIKQTTGINARGLVRMIGGRNLLLMGGAALAGGMAATAGTHGGSSGGSFYSPDAPPAAPSAPPTGPARTASAMPAFVPPPPPPPAVDLPPIPGAPPSESPSGEYREIPPALTFAAVRTMVAAALADGILTPEEKDAIFHHLGESDLPPDQVAQVHRDLLLPASPAELAAMAGSPSDGEILYRFAAIIILVDHQVTTIEKAWLEQLAAALHLPAERRTALAADLAFPE